MPRTPDIFAHQLIATHGTGAAQLLVDKIVAAARLRDEAELAFLDQALRLVKDHYALEGPGEATGTLLREEGAAACPDAPGQEGHVAGTCKTV